MSIRIYYHPDHRDNPVIAATPAEVNAFIDDLLTQPYDLSMADCYPVEAPAGEAAPALSVGVDPERGVGGLAFQTPNGRWFSKGQVSEYEEVVYCFYGTEREFPRDSEIPEAGLRAAVVEFLEAGGKRPINVEWQAAPAVG